VSEAFAVARPLVLWGLLALPPWVLWRLYLRRRDAVPYAPLQYRPAAGRRRLAWLQPVVEALLLASVVAGLAGPYHAASLELVEDEGIDVVLVLDVSLSMLATDFEPNRLAVLQRVARDFIARGGHNRVGLVIFAKDAFVHSPLTTDHQVLEALLDSAGVHAIDQAKSGGTAIGDALLVAAERLVKARLEHRGQAVVLITDGASNSGIDPLLAARYLRQRAIRLYAVGIGGDKKVPVTFEGRRVGGDNPYLAVLDDAQLEAVAAHAGGHYYRAADAGALESIFGQLSRLEHAPLKRRTVESRRYWTSACAAAALGFFTLHLVLAGIVLRRPLR